jgi:two-component system, NtrC family, response regulator HydG
MATANLDIVETMSGLVTITRPLEATELVRLRAQVDALTKPAILLSPDYRILAANAAYGVHYGTSVKEGHDTCFAVSHGYESPCDENGERCPLAQARRTGRAERVCHVHHHASGPEHVNVELVPQKNARGETVAFIEIIDPISEAAAHAHAGVAFVGRSPAFSHLLAMISRVAPTEATVLLLGESGTGKELCARTVHDRSTRHRGPFVPVECSGLSETLFESELFGHVKGAFTGAIANKVGLVEAADGGTLFLDELGEIPPALQVKLLRLLETGTYRRVGDTEVRRADFRLVCATHRDLPAMVEDGSFRADLYYRLSVFPILVPALRERLDDLPLLAEALLLPYRKHLDDAALAQLARHRFPGNIRELKNILVRAVIVSEGERIGPEALPWADELPDTSRTTPVTVTRPPPAPTPGAAPAETVGPWPWGGAVLPLDDVVDRYLAWAATRPIERSALASALGLSPRTLYRRLAEAKRRLHGHDSNDTDGDPHVG